MFNSSHLSPRAKRSPAGGEAARELSQGMFTTSACSDLGLNTQLQKPSLTLLSLPKYLFSTYPQCPVIGLVTLECQLLGWSPLQTAEAGDDIVLTPFFPSTGPIDKCFRCESVSEGSNAWINGSVFTSPPALKFSSTPSLTSERAVSGGQLRPEKTIL